MRNDARPIGEEFRDIAEHEEPEGAADPGESEQGHTTPDYKPFVIRRDPADQVPDASDR